MAELTDEALLKRIAQRDEAALAHLYDRYAKLSYSLAYRVMGDAAAAEDVVQDAYIKVWRMAHTYSRSRGTVKAWMLSVVHHQAIDVCRARRSTVPLTPQDADEPGIDPPAPDNVLDMVTAKLDRDALLKAMEAIPTDQRRMIELAFFKGYTHREIADLTRIPLGTVKGRIRIGMEKLRDLLIKERV
jgi:RNA polymerase sigma-70 factor (ECF subfamily)